MDEEFYTPPIPQPRSRSSRSRGQGTTTYQFRQPQTRINPLALRRLQLQDVESQRREEIAAGNQELAAVREMARLEQQEYLIRQNIAKEKQVASAQREVAVLDPEKTPHYAGKYAEIMSRHPLAQDNKFLNEAFTDGMRINYREAQHRFNELEEGQKQAGKEELEWIKASSAYAATGGAVPPDKAGMHDWGALNAGKTKAALATRAAADADNKGLPITKTVTKEGDTTVTREAPKPAKPELTEGQKIANAKLEGTLTGQHAQLEIFKNQLNAPGADKVTVQKNIDATTASIALTQAQVSAVDKVINPPPVAATPPAPTATTPPPAAAPPPIKPLSSEERAQFNTHWNDLTDKMKTAQANADLHRKDRDAATQKLTELSAFASNDEFTKHAATSKASGDMVDQFEKEYADASALRSTMLERRAASPPDDSPRPPLDSLSPYTKGQ